MKKGGTGPRDWSNWQGKQEAVNRTIVANLWEGTPSGLKAFEGLNVAQVRQVLATSESMCLELTALVQTVRLRLELLEAGF